MLHVGDNVSLAFGERRYRLVVDAVDEGTDLFPITLYSQRHWYWMDEPMADGTYTIGEAGCALTASAMVCSQIEPSLTPMELNHRLKDVDGYSGANLVWEKVVDCVLSKVPGAYVYYSGPTNRWKDGVLIWRDGLANMERVEVELSQGPCIMEIDFVPGGPLNSHFVLATGFNRERTDIYIYDPWDGVRTLLLQRYARKDWILARAIYGLRLLRASLS